MAYAFGTVVYGTMEQVEDLVTAALGDEGFGVLTRIDVQGTFKAKIGRDIDPYVILGACNPNLAYGAIEADRDMGALLPCNVVLRQEGGAVAVRMMDPSSVLGIVGNPVVDAFGIQARAALERVVRAIA